MIDLYSLLARGYFPANLPAPFSTRSFAKVMDADPALVNPSYKSTKLTKPVRHSMARVGIDRRLFSIPNPLSQQMLCRAIVKNWSKIDAIAAHSNISCSRPVIGQAPSRSLVPFRGHDDLPVIRLQTRAASKYILKADISKCYPSIYTHSIPWVIHGKDLAKSNRKDTLIGNLIDKLVRNGQDGQTIGLPIGPDSSFLIAELVLGGIDKDLETEFGKLKGFRFVDEFEFGFRVRSHAERALSVLRGVLREYELELNQFKTEIVELPTRIEAAWVPQLRNFRFRQSSKAQATDLMTYFDLAFQLARENPKDHVLKYSVARLSPREDPKEAILERNWPLLQQFLFQCLMVETGTFYRVLEILIRYHKLGFDIDIALISDVLNSEIQRQCDASYTSEAAWAVWAAVFFGINISSGAAKALSATRDSIVALVTLDAAQRGLIRSGLDTTIWEAYMDEESLFDSQWLLAYEANVKGWLRSRGGTDHVSKDPFFSFLKEKHVEFYEIAKLPTAVPRGVDVSEIVFAPLLYYVYEPDEN